MLSSWYDSSHPPRSLAKNILMVATIITCCHSTRCVKCSGNIRDGDGIASTTPTSDRFPATGGPDAVTIHGLACPYMSLVGKKHSWRFTYFPRPIFLDVSKCLTPFRGTPVDRLVCKYFDVLPLSPGGFLASSIQDAIITSERE